MKWQSLLFVLLIALLAWSSLEVVQSKHQSRKLFQQLVQSEKQYDELQIEWGQLLLEQHSMATHHQIKAIATSKLQMKVPDAKETSFVEVSK